jgi:DNA-binding transcriptional LysR family regulator
VFDLHRLRLLRELEHRGTITAVAAALSYSPSTISQQLSLLETEAGVPLLEPVGRRVRLTPQAEILVRHADIVLRQMEAAEAEIAQSLKELTARCVSRPSRPLCWHCFHRPSPTCAPCACRKPRPRHATWEYSWMMPPRRSRRLTLN